MQCRICGSREGHREYDAREMMFGIRDLHRYFQCADCGCLQIANIPQQPEKYYRSDYYSFLPPKETGLTAWLLNERRRYSVLRKGFVGKLLMRAKPLPHFDFLQTFKPFFNSESRILDVGCGSGHILRALRASGFQHARGVDPYIAKDIKVNGVPLIVRAHLNEVTETFDIILFNHSLEHMAEQLASLRHALRLLTLDGICAVRIPLVSSKAWENYGVNWVQLDAPRHLFLHSRASFERLSTAAGFQIISVDYDSTAFQFWGSEQYCRDVPLMDPKSYAVHPGESSFTSAQIRTFEAEAARLNAMQLGDQATFLLRRVVH